MSGPRTVWVLSLIALVTTGFAMAVGQDGGGDIQAARRQQQALGLAQPPMTMKRLLGLWEDKSQKLQTLEVVIYRVDKNPAWEEEEHYVGHAAF